VIPLARFAGEGGGRSPPGEGGRWCVPHLRGRAFRGEATNETARITVDPNQCGGRPCLRGLRIRVASRDELLADYPLLEDADITPALKYAARSSDHPVPRVA
jgi:uncharacterized protein (DUF433 family)